MENDRLEDYIKEHRLEFDQNSPPPMVWMNVEKHLDKQKYTAYKEPANRGVSVMRVMQIAAMFVVVLGVGLLIGLQLNNGASNIYQNPQLQEFVEAEKHYTNEIDNMWNTVNTANIEDKDMIREDLAALDAVYLELKNELLSNPHSDTDYVVNAMIANYRSKIGILNIVLEEYKSKEIEKQINLNDENIEL